MTVSRNLSLSNGAIKHFLLLRALGHLRQQRLALQPRQQLLRQQQRQLPRHASTTISIANFGQTSVNVRATPTG